MIGTIIGDIAGSIYEFHNHRSKDFELLASRCYLTDDSVMTLAIAQALMKVKGKVAKLDKSAISCMQSLGRTYPFAGYGGLFSTWLRSDDPKPYNSWGNGAAMRVSACPYVATTLEEALTLSDTVTAVTHNHPEGIKGARVVTEMIWMALHGAGILEMEDVVKSRYYPLDFKLDDIRNKYSFDESCQGTLPPALEAFFESTSFEDAIRNAISIGGDSDTIAAITGSIAEAYYGVPSELRVKAIGFMDDNLLKILNDFESKYGYCSVKDVDGTSKMDKVVPGKMKPSLNEKERAFAIAGIATDNGNMKLPNTKMFNHLYKGCDILRGPINQDDYKTYLIPLLFLKRVSDVYDEETDIAVDKYGEDLALFDEKDLHKFCIPEGCHWNDIRECAENVGEAISNSMLEIERANPESLGGLFSSFDDASWTDKNKLSDERLHSLIEHFSKVKVGNHDYSDDVMGDAYEYLLLKFADASKKNAGEIYTPRTIVKLCVNLLDPKPGDTVYDPACGTGGMLIEAIRHIRSIGTEMDTYGKIYAQEKNLSTSAIAKMNMFLHGASDFHIVQGDTLRAPGFTEGNKLKTFNCVIANPPFGLDHWGAAQFESDLYGRRIWGCPNDSNADYAWVQHMVCSMDRDNGRCAVILPQGALFHGGKEGEIRKLMVNSDKLEAVIALAGGVFYGAGVSACILFLNNSKPEDRRNKVILIDASTICTPLRAQNTMSENDVERTFKLYNDYQDVTDFSKVVTIEDIASKDYTLSVGSYIEKTTAETKDPSQVRKEYIEAVMAVRSAEKTLRTLLEEGGFING